MKTTSPYLTPTYPEEAMGNHTMAHDPDGYLVEITDPTAEQQIDDLYRRISLLEDQVRNLIKAGQAIGRDLRP